MAAARDKEAFSAKAGTESARKMTRMCMVSLKYYL